MEQNILIAEEVADILRVDKQRIYELVRSNSLPFIRLGERQYRFSRQAIEEWMLKGGTSQKAEDGKEKNLALGNL